MQSSHNKTALSTLYSILFIIYTNFCNMICVCLNDVARRRFELEISKTRVEEVPVCLSTRALRERVPREGLDSSMI